MLQTAIKSKIKPKRALAMLLLWVLVMSSLTGCDNRAEALELAKGGKATAEAMAKFYDSLITDTQDIRRLEIYLLNFNRLPRDANVLELKPAERNLLQTRINELRKRAKLARALAATHAALEKFASYDASAEISGSVTSLAGSIRGLNTLPVSAEGGGINPAEIFGMIASDLAAWRQSKDLRRGSELIVATIRRMEILLYKEKEAYKYIPAEKGRKVLRVFNNCIAKANCSKTPVKKYLLEMNYDPKAFDEAVAESQTKNAMLGYVKDWNDEKTQTYMSAADAIEETLQELAKNHQKFGSKQGMSLSVLKQRLERAQEYVNALQKTVEETETE